MKLEVKINEVMHHTGGYLNVSGAAAFSLC